MKVLMTLALVLLLAGCAAGQDSAGPTTAEEETTARHAEEETAVLQGGGDLRRPPESTLSYGGREVKGALGSFCWSYGNSGVCADKASAPLSQETLTVPSGSEMVFHYGGQHSPDTVQATAVPLDKKGTSTASADSDLSGSLKVHGSGVETTIPVELPPGKYGVYVWVREPQGDAGYGFRIKVRRMVK